jgi:polysaccharide export outer membrane protein
MAPVPVARGFRLPVIAAVTGFGLSGCVHTSGPVAAAQPQNNLDYMSYGRPYGAPPPAVAAQPANPAGGGGAIAALRASFASTPAPTISAVPTSAVSAAYAAAPEPATYDNAYHLDAGDKLRVVVFGQEGLTNSYAIDAGGSITMPLIGAVPARGRTTAGLAAEISRRLRNGFIREPSVAVEIESYRPFFILGEVAAPGQYPYVPNMTVESAVAIAGGFSPRAKRDTVTVTHNDGAGPTRTVVPLGTSVSPGDTVLVGERWF